MGLNLNYWHSAISTAELFFHATMEVRTEEEDIQDFPTMLSAIGGFVGMVLGWSAKDLAKLIPAAVNKCIKS